MRQHQNSTYNQLNKFSRILQKRKKEDTVRSKSVSCRLSNCSKNRRRRRQQRPMVSVNVKQCLCEMYASNSNPFRNKDVLLYLSLVHDDNKNHSGNAMSVCEIVFVYLWMLYENEFMGPEMKEQIIDGIFWNILQTTPH